MAEYIYVANGDASKQFALFNQVQKFKFGTMNYYRETNSTNYTSNAILNSDYLMLDNKFLDKIKLTWGVRVEKYSQYLAADGKPGSKELGSFSYIMRLLMKNG